MLLRFLPGLIVAIAGVLILKLLIPFGVADPGFEQPNSLAPDDFPRYLAWIVIGTGVLMLATDWHANGFGLRAPGPFAPARALPFAGALVASVLAIGAIGIEASAFGFVAGMLVLASDLEWRRALGVAAGFAALIHVLFIRMAGVPIPSTHDILF